MVFRTGDSELQKFKYKLMNAIPSAETIPHSVGVIDRRLTTVAKLAYDHYLQGETGYKQ